MKAETYLFMSYVYHLPVKTGPVIEPVGGKNTVHTCPPVPGPRKQLLQVESLLSTRTAKAKMEKRSASRINSSRKLWKTINIKVSYDSVLGLVLKLYNGLFSFRNFKKCSQFRKGQFIYSSTCLSKLAGI